MLEIGVHEVPRNADDALVEACSQLLSDFANWHVLQCAPWQRPPAKPRDLEFIRELLANPEAWLLLATSGDEPVGLIHLSLRHTRDKPGWADRDFGYVEAEWVEPKFRRRGAGAAMIEAAKQHFRELGVDSIETNVWGWNSASQSLHASMGFEPKNVNLVTWL